MIDATLVLLLKGHPVSEVLLGYKKIGFGQGKYTGFGGKIEPGEGAAEAALRELTEETGVTVPKGISFQQVAILEFEFPHKPEWSQRVHVFATHHWKGTPIEKDEMIPQWFPIENIPYDKMWDDGYYWLPKIIAGDKFTAYFIFMPDNATVASVEYSPL